MLLIRLERIFLADWVIKRLFCCAFINLKNWLNACQFSRFNVFLRRIAQIGTSMNEWRVWFSIYLLLAHRSVNILFNFLQLLIFLGIIFDLLFVRVLRILILNVFLNWPIMNLSESRFLNDWSFVNGKFFRVLQNQLSIFFRFRLLNIKINI